MYKIIGGDQKEYGPISTEQIRQWIAEGRVNAQTQACAEGTQDWRPLEMFPEFGLSQISPTPSGTIPSAESPPPQKPPGAIKVFGILNIVFGSLGLLCTPFSFISVSLAATQIHYSPFMTHWLYGSLFISMIGGGIMLASGVGLLKRFSWARRLAIYYAAFACFVSVLNPIIVLTNLPEGGPNPEVQKAGAIIGVVFGLLIGLTYNILLIFFLSKPSIKEALGEKE